jgi:TonB family protein
VAGDGRVADVAVEGSSGFAIFDDAALDAVRRWRFDAGRLRTVEVLHRVRFEIVAD